MDRRRMPEIVQARLVASPAVPLDVGNRTKSTESRADRRVGQGSAVALAKQQVTDGSRWAGCDECLQGSAQSGADGNDARLKELRASDVEQRSG